MQRYPSPVEDYLVEPRKSQMHWCGMVDQTDRPVVFVAAAVAAAVALDIHIHIVATHQAVAGADLGDQTDVASEESAVVEVRIQACVQV